MRSRNRARTLAIGLAACLLFTGCGAGETYYPEGWDAAQNAPAETPTAQEAPSPEPDITQPSAPQTESEPNSGPAESPAGMVIGGVTPVDAANDVLEAMPHNLQRDILLSALDIINSPDLSYDDPFREVEWAWLETVGGSVTHENRAELLGFDIGAPLSWLRVQAEGEGLLFFLLFHDGHYLGMTGIMQVSAWDTNTAADRLTIYYLDPSITNPDYLGPGPSVTTEITVAWDAASNDLVFTPTPLPPDFQWIPAGRYNGHD